jgi:polyisoprenoid-binding protein YceI
MGVTAKIRTGLRKPLTWIIGIPIIVAILAVGGPYIYLHTESSHNPKALSFSQLATSSTAATPTATATGAPIAAPTAVASADAAASGTSLPAGAPVPAGAPMPAPAAATPAANSVAGSWTVGSGSQARYGVDDTVLGQTSRVVGSTSDVSGSLQVTGMTVTSAHIVVNMASVNCGCVHDVMYRQLLQTSSTPNATFDLTSPIDITAIPTPGQIISVPVTGNFTIHGITHSTSFTLDVTDINNRIAVKGSIPVSYGAYAINPPPSAGMGGLSNTTIDLLVAFDKTS